MKLQVNTKNFVKILSSVSSNIQKGSSVIPITKFVLIHTDGDRLITTTSNEKAQVSHFYTMSDIHDFKACVLCNVLLNTLKLVKDEIIDMELKERKNKSLYLQIKAGKSTYKIEACDPKDFMSLNFDNYTGSFKTNGNEVFEKISIANKCTSSNDVRVNLTCVSLDVAQDVLRIKGFTPNFGTEQLIDVQGNMPPILIDKQSANLISGHVFSGETNVYTNGIRVKISNGALELIITLTEGRPLPLEQIWNQVKKESCVFNRTELLSACERAVNFTSIDDNLLRFNFEGNVLTIKADDIGNANEAEEIVDISSKKFNDIEIGLDGNFLATVLRSFKQDSLYMHVNQINTPIFIFEDTDGPKEKWVVMPMMISAVETIRKSKS